MPLSAALLPAREHPGNQRPPGTAAPSPERPDDLYLAETVDRALRATGHASLRRLDVGVRDGVVVLRGRVPTYYLKQLAQEAVLRVKGINQLSNRLEVR